MKNYRKNDWLLLLACFCLTTATAQTAFEATTHLGAIWRHTPKLTTQPGGALWGQEFGLRFQTNGRRDWHQWQRYPAFGLSLVHVRFGEGSHRDGYGLLPNISIPVYRGGAFTAFFRLGTGLAWVTDPYNYFENPGENAIGSHWNNITQFRLGGELRLGDHLRLHAGASLTHFSNGGAALPNYGINLPSGYAGIAWSPRPLREADFKPSTTGKKAARRWGAMVQGGLALVEYAVYDGPRYAIRTASVAGLFHFNRVNRALLGVDYEFNDAVYAFGLHTGDFESETQARRGATRLALFVADEFLFGNVGVQLQLGAYVGGAYNRYVFKRQYSKLTTRYYFPALFKTEIKPHVGIALKAHASTAEYISMNAGLAF